MMQEDDYYSDITKVIEEDTAAKVIRVLNSTFCFCLAYIVTIYTFNWATGISAFLNGFHPVIEYNHVHLPDNSPLWNKLTVVFVYSAGTFACIILAIVASLIFHSRKKKDSIQNVFWFWLYLHAINIVMIQMFIAVLGTENYTSPFYKYLAVVLSFLEMPQVMAVGLFIPAAISLILVGFNAAVPFLSFAFSQRIVNNQYGKRNYFIQVALLPMIIGAFITLPLSLPRGFVFEALNYAGLFVIILTAYLRLEFLMGVEAFRYESLQFFSWFVLAILVLVIAGLKILLADGIML